METLNQISAAVMQLVDPALRWIDQTTGCNLPGANEDCRAWHWAIKQFHIDPVRAWIVVAALCIFRAVLPKLQEFAQARFKAWREDHLHARFMRAYEAYRAGLLRPFSGFLIGDLARGMIRPLRVRGDASILTFGGAGCGKGVGLVIPNCLRWRWQVIVDWGAEIVAVCAPVWRRLGVEVVVVNPTKQFTDAPYNLPVNRFNPLAGIDPTQDGFGVKCRAVADSLFIRTGGESEPFFNDAGVGMADYCSRQIKVEKGEAGTLIDVYQAILGGLKNQREFFGGMSRSDDTFIKAAGERLSHMVEKGERVTASIVQHVETKLAWMADTQFVDSLSGHDVDFDALRGRGKGKRGCVIVFVLPPNLAVTHGAWVKTCLNAVISAMVDDIPENKVLLTIDEASVLGNWSWIDQGMALLRRYRVQLHAIYQSVPQAQGIFGAGLDGMMENAHIKNFVGVNNSVTANHLSSALGTNKDGKPVMTPDQLGRMRPGEQITFIRNQRSILVQNRPYYHRLTMRRGVGPNPFHKGMPRLPALYPVWLLKGAVVTLWAMTRPTPRQAVIMGLVGAGMFYGRTAWAWMF